MKIEYVTVIGINEAVSLKRLIYFKIATLTYNFVKNESLILSPVFCYENFVHGIIINSRRYVSRFSHGSPVPNHLQLMQTTA